MPGNFFSVPYLRIRMRVGVKRVSGYHSTNKSMVYSRSFCAEFLTSAMAGLREFFASVHKIRRTRMKIQNLCECWISGTGFLGGSLARGGRELDHFAASYGDYRRLRLGMVVIRDVELDNTGHGAPMPFL